jgi:hypothetical protein
LTTPDQGIGVCPSNGADDVDACGSDVDERSSKENKQQQSKHGRKLFAVTEYAETLSTNMT